MKPVLTPYLERLRVDLEGIVEDLDALIARSTIRYVNPNTPDSRLVFVSAADFGWAPSDPATEAAQMQLLARYRSWSTRLRLLFPHPTPALAEKLDELDGFTRRWIERDGGWDHSIPASIDQARQLARSRLAGFSDLLDLASHAGSGELRLVPDTSALIRNPDLGSYGRAFGPAELRLHLVPTVLGELDDLKDRGKSQELRDKAQAVVKRLKGLRVKGSLATGVKVTKSITVQADHVEPDVRGVIEWLDPTVADDRILASALRLQSDDPGGSVFLVTSDINLQNKADAVGMPTIETPPSPATLQANLGASVGWRSGTGGAVAIITLVNEGPAVAREIEYSVTPADSGFPRFTCGPWTVADLKPGGRDEQVVIFTCDSAAVTARWTDDKPQKKSWHVPFPPRPAT